MSLLLLDGIENSRGRKEWSRNKVKDFETLGHSLNPIARICSVLNYASISRLSINRIFLKKSIHQSLRNYAISSLSRNEATKDANEDGNQEFRKRHQKRIIVFLIMFQFCSKNWRIMSPAEIPDGIFRQFDYFVRNCFPVALIRIKLN